MMMNTETVIIKTTISQSVSWTVWPDRACNLARLLPLLIALCCFCTIISFVFYCYCCCLWTTASSAHDATQRSAWRDAARTTKPPRLPLPLPLPLCFFFSLISASSSSLFLSLSLLWLWLWLAAVGLHFRQFWAPLGRFNGRTSSRQQQRQRLRRRRRRSSAIRTFLTLFDAADFGPTLASTLALTVAKHGSFLGFVFVAVLPHFISYSFVCSALWLLLC